MKTKKLIGALLLSLSAGIWGGMFVVVKSVVGTIPPVQLVWLRYAVGIVVLVGFVIASRVRWYWNWADIKIIVLMGIIGNGISIVTQETGTWYSSAQLGSVITAATPTFMVLFSWWLFAERPTRSDAVGLGLATLGVLAIVGLQFSGRHALLGGTLLLVAGLTWAFMSVLVRKISPTYNALQVTLLSTIVAFVCLTPWVLTHWSVMAGVALLAPHIALSIFYLGAISTALAFVMWNRGLKLLDSSLSGLFFLFQPIIGGLLGWLILGETIGIGFLFGTVLIVGSVLVSIKRL